MATACHDMGDELIFFNGAMRIQLADIMLYRLRLYRHYTTTNICKPLHTVGRVGHEG